MNREIRDLWTAALRSGDYKQGKGALHAAWTAGSQYCCLGVLCELAVEAGAVSVDEDDTGDKRYGSTSEGGVLPFEVIRWAGLVDAEAGVMRMTNAAAGELKTPITYYDVDGFRESATAITELNDNARYDFNDIADVIEAQF